MSTATKTEIHQEAIPKELRDQSKWVVWQYEVRNDKRTKVPYTPRMQNAACASVSDPATWSTFGAALTVFEMSDRDGVGYVLTEDDPYTGGDLDHCYNPATGAVEAWAQEIVEELDSYTEITPSGEGLRILCKGRLSRGSKGNKRGPFEMYTSGRFLTFTGRHLPGTPTTIEERTAEVLRAHEKHFPPKVQAPGKTYSQNGHTQEYIPDELIISAISKARNSSKFRALWGGSTSGYSSHSEADQALVSQLAFWTQDAGQLDSLMRQSGLCREKWLNREDYRRQTIDTALSGLGETYNWNARRKGNVATSSDVRDSVQGTHDDGDDNLFEEPQQDGGRDEQHSAGTMPPSAERKQANIGNGSDQLTDLGNAERLVVRHGHNLRYCHPWQKWFVWDGMRWRVDATAMVERLAKETVRSIYAEAADIEDDKTRGATVRHAKASEADSKMKAMLARARAEEGIPLTPDELDEDPWLFNCLNGTLDLLTGQLRPHSRADHLTKLSLVRYDPEAKCPVWFEFLDRIMQGNAGLIQFLQRAAGYSLTGSTVERVLFLLFGIGANGKSTFLETLRAVFGDYALRTPTETLMMRREAAIQNDVARLKGARFVSASETDEGKRLAESLIKDLTGGDVMSARFLYAETFEFKPQCKIWLSTNHKPVITGTDKGIWDRIRLVPFEVRIPEQSRDKQLGIKLMAELPGILTWLVQGCMDWQKSGLGMPPEVVDATETYRAEMDILAPFIEERCIAKPQASVTSKELYNSYLSWCDENGEKPISSIALGMRIKEKGFRNVRGTGGKKKWLGLGLAAD